ncbi:hypothetical protein BD626DRAFT_519638 [Schizophyllum amplum]|uniref:Uncharacterized protein n=1 Tax=Schizophyllum amplum TaxID=97359 RepID=A0A550BVA0_9AGAR|nr:hypothetical protein BD626DRAFT_519638 [Auriculariopsis ampla]
MLNGPHSRRRRQRRAREGVLEPSAERRTQRRVARSSASSSDSGVPYEDFAPTRRRSRRRCILTTPQPPGPEVVTPAASSPPWASALNTAPLPLRTSQILVAIYGKLPSGLHLYGENCANYLLVNADRSNSMEPLAQAAWNPEAVSLTASFATLTGRYDFLLDAPHSPLRGSE